MSTVEFVATLIFRILLMLSAFWSVAWVYKQARRERKRAWIHAILVLITWPVGLVVWLYLHARQPRVAGPVKSTVLPNC
jgi:hypothetical protein